MIKPEIGKTAGEVWRYLGKKGQTPLSELPNKVNTHPDQVHQAIGWLAREDKVKFTKEGRTTRVALTDNELNNYQQTQCQM
jgi:predicted transcriptional regulator